MIQYLTIPFAYTVDEPTNQLAAVLKMLIERNGVSERDTDFNGFRTRISELKLEHKLNIKTERKEFTNQFDRKAHYNVHSLEQEDIPAAIKLFKAIN